MIVKASDLRRGEEIDCGYIKSELYTMKYDPETERYNLVSVPTGQAIYLCSRLIDLVEYTNRVFRLKDVAVED